MMIIKLVPGKLYELIIPCDFRPCERELVKDFSGVPKAFHDNARLSFRGGEVFMYIEAKTWENETTFFFLSPCGKIVTSASRGVDYEPEKYFVAT